MAWERSGQESTNGGQPTLWAVSDLHTGHLGNKPVAESLHPSSPDDWLIVAGDVAERTDEIRWTLDLLRRRFAKVIWVPGNHELWTTNRDPVQIFGRARYDYLVNMCDEMGVVTPEHPFPVWTERGGPATIVPMFLLYDYTFLPEGAMSKAEGYGHRAAAQRGGHRRIPALTGAVPHSRGLVSRPARQHPRPSRTARLDDTDRAGEPLSAGARALRRVVLPGILAVVRNHQDRRLAHPLQRCLFGLRPSAHSANHLVRRRAVRGSVGGLPAGVAASQAVHLAAPGVAGSPVRARLPQRLRRSLRDHPRDAGNRRRSSGNDCGSGSHDDGAHAGVVGAAARRPRIWRIRRCTPTRPAWPRCPKRSR